MALLLYINMNCLKLDKEVLVHLNQFVVDHTIGSTCVDISPSSKLFRSTTSSQKTQIKCELIFSNFDCR